MFAYELTREKIENDVKITRAEKSDKNSDRNRHCSIGQTRQTWPKLDFKGGIS